MDKYRSYLAAEVLNESHVINYRQLSRALKVHTHLAKQMLFDFHQKQNAKKSHSVHATYLITGTAIRAPGRDDLKSTDGIQTQESEDLILQSSPFPSSAPVPDPPLQVDGDDNDAEIGDKDIPTTTVMLVKEEELEDAKAEFEDITSIFVYSLQPGPIHDVQSLTDTNRQLIDKFLTEDPLEVYKVYGIIQNPNVRRRTGVRKHPATASAAIPSKPAHKPPEKKPVPLNTNSRQNSGSSEKQAPKTSTDTKAKAATLKREGSDLFKSFAKSKQPKAKSASIEASSVQDDVMKGMSDDEDDDSVMIEISEADEAKANAARAKRAEVQKGLRDMMDIDDEPTPDIPTQEEAEEAEDVEDAEVDDGSPIDVEPVDEERKDTVTVVGGRRRGRRRVMKKKTVKDDEGYLVTKEEAVWESFSEDDPPPKKQKSSFAPSTATKGKKAAGKPGQGNITSFFSKK